MRTDERLTLRARQILDDPTLPQSQRIKNAASLLAHLKVSIRESPSYLDALLSEISDPTVRANFRAALTDTPVPVLDVQIQIEDELVIVDTPVLDKGCVG